MERRSRRWYLIRIELALGTAAPVLLAMLMLMAPGYARLSMAWWELPFTLSGIGLALAGALWMWRIFLADLESGIPPWRHRDGR